MWQWLYGWERECCDYGGAQGTSLRGCWDWGRCSCLPTVPLSIPLSCTGWCVPAAVQSEDLTWKPAFVVIFFLVGSLWRSCLSWTCKNSCGRNPPQELCYVFVGKPMEQSLSQGEVHWSIFSDNLLEQTCVTRHKNLPLDINVPGVVLCLEKLRVNLIASGNPS